MSRSIIAEVYSSPVKSLIDHTAESEIDLEILAELLSSPVGVELLRLAVDVKLMSNEAARDREIELQIAKSDAGEVQ
jgi:hypothetical protein